MTKQEKIQELSDQIKHLAVLIAEKEKEIDNYEIDRDESEYDDWLDSIYGPYDLGYCKFYASQVLKDCDPIAYNVGFSDYLDTLDKEDEQDYKDLQEELEQLKSDLEDLETELSDLEEEEEDD